MPAAVLPNFAPLASSSSVNASAWARSSPSATPALGPPDQLEAGGDVAPLIGAAHLELDAQVAVEVLEVGRLEEHVAELGEREAAPSRDCTESFDEHVRDREVLPDVPQELEHRDLAEPVEVVDHDRRRRAVEVEESLELRADPGEVRLERRPVEEVPLRRRAGRVADHPRSAAHEDDRAAAPPLEMDERRDRHEVSDVERRAGGVEPVVGGDLASGRQAGGEPWGRVVEEAAPAELVEESREAVGGSSGSVVRGCGRHSRARRGVSGKGDGGSRPNIPSCYRARRHADQPRAAPASSSTASAGGPAARPTLKRTAIAIPIILLVAFVGRGRGGIAGGRRRLQLLRERPSGPG